MPSFSRESSRRSGVSSGWGDSDESSADEFSRKASKKISRGALSTKSSHWGDTDESSDDSKVRRIYSQNPSRQPSKLSSWGDSGTSSDSDAPAYGGAVKPKPISARASAREKSTLSRASKWSDEESDEEEHHFSKKSKSKKISSVSKWSDDQSEASIKSPQPSKKSPESSKKEPEPARKSLDELMSKISYGESRNEPSRKTSNMSKRPVSLRAPDKAPPKSPPKANQESEEKRETSIKKIEKLLEKKPVLPTPKSESSNDSDKEHFVLNSTNSERKQESSEDNQSRSSRVKGSRISKISRISQWSDEDSDEEEPPKSDLKDETGKLPKRVKEISSSGLSRKNAIRASGRSSSRISSKANEKNESQELSDLMKFSASNSSSSKFEVKEEKSEIRPKTRAQIQPEFSTASKWSDNDDSSDTEVEMDNKRFSEIFKTEANIPIKKEKYEKSSKTPLIPKSNQASALSEWSDHESDKMKIQEKKVSSLSKWSDNESDKHESRRSEFSKADISALSKWSDNESEKDKPKSRISMAQLSSLSKWSDNESEKNESRRSKVSRAEISALSKWSDNESDKNKSLGKSRISKAQVSSLSKWSVNESDKNESRRSKFSRAEISALSKWSDNESEKDESLRKSKISKAKVSALSKWSDNESDKQEIEIKEEKPSTPEWRKRINIDDYFAVFNRMREEKNAQPINSSSLQKESETKEEREISALSAWTDKQSVNRSNISKWTDNESDDENEMTPKNIPLARALDVRSKSSKWSDNQSEIRSALSKWSDQESNDENQGNKDQKIEENTWRKAPSRVTSIESRASSKWGTQRGSSVYSSHTEADSANVSSLSKWSDNQSEKPELSNQSAWTDVLSDPEKTPTNAAQQSAENQKVEIENKVSRLSSWTSTVSSKWGDVQRSNNSSIRSSELASGTSGEHSLSSKHSLPSSRRSLDYPKNDFGSRLSEVSDNIQLLEEEPTKLGPPPVPYRNPSWRGSFRSSALESTIMTPYTQDFTQTQSVIASQGQTVRQKRIKQAIDYTILEISEPDTMVERDFSSGSNWTVENSQRVAPGRMNKLSSIDSNTNQNRANPFMNPFDATVAHKESPPPAIPKSAVPMSSGTDWTDTEAKLTKEEEAIPAKYLMTTDNIESDPDDYVNQFNSKAINADNDFGPINDDTSLIDVDMELPPKQMVEIVPKKKGLCGASCSGRSNKSVWESIKSATKLCKK
ncbi:Oidioi.mRNA.OKI2018_I69.chr2.g4426.t1.cds [Oikopleura dioica]|uniref:Oidioi.mRNA.OKI2018_I69.chr2.g4426.t1.cds n=1 Tax=Oikopleura dioica TaxID=34765 RepID=A0ABN7SXC5_OIKDI|nr:Oidioi.mRNA.OKI2018_I69.chr2.g4426.t1.cds [Oikopleura dioica]